MPYDTMTMAAVADELHAVIVGGRIQKIVQPSEKSVGLCVYQGGKQHWLLLSVDPQSARLHLSSEKLAKAFATPSAFVMLLRKHLDGSRLNQVEQVPFERVTELTFLANDVKFSLIAEIMGRRSNVILIDENRKILGAVKIIPPHRSRIRPILPGRPYELPPAHLRDADTFGEGRRRNPYQEPGEVAMLLKISVGSSPTPDSLLGLLVGASPFLVSQIFARAESTAGDSELSHTTNRIRSLVAAAADLYSLYHTRSWSPCTFADASGRKDFSPFTVVGCKDVVRRDSMSEAIDETVGGVESHDALTASRREIVGHLERRMRHTQHKVAALQSRLEAADESEAVKEAGQLVLSFSHTISPGNRELVISELDKIIPLNPLLSASENAELIFKRYRKLRDARTRIPGILEEARREESRLTDAMAFVQLAGSEADLRDLRRDLEEASPPKPDHSGKKIKPRGPARYSFQGFTVLAGRNARENDELTFRLAKRDDTWLHARERTGAHVVLRGVDRTPPEDVVHSAAGLAAFLSEARFDTAVDVIVTEVRHVRKIPGGPPGRVSCTRSRTVRVQPTVDGWQRQN